MRVDTKMVIAFALVFFICEGIDYLLPPNNKVFNAALGLLAALTEFAKWSEQQSKTVRGPFKTRVGR